MTGINVSDIKVTIADDHAIVREGLKKILQEAGITVIGEASNGIEAIELAGNLQPDVALLDIEMPLMNGIEACREIKRQNPGAKLVILTMHEENEYVFQALKAGAIAYVLKDKASDTLVETIKVASKGMSLLQPGMAAEILMEFAALDEKKDEQHRLWSLLTKREKEILKHLAKGMSNKEIAQTLYISDKTVRNHLRNVFEKLHINDRTAAAVMAVRQGLA